jgi:hypothetical protein
MPPPTIYATEEERRDARYRANKRYRERIKDDPEKLKFLREKSRQYQQKYYQTHRDKICEKNLERYHTIKSMETINPEEE